MCPSSLQVPACCVTHPFLPVSVVLCVPLMVLSCVTGGLWSAETGEWWLSSCSRTRWELLAISCNLGLSSFCFWEAVSNRRIIHPVSSRAPKPFVSTFNRRVSLQTITLSTLPPALANGTVLEKLDLSGAKVTAGTLPAQYGFWQNLTWFR